MSTHSPGNESDSAVVEILMLAVATNATLQNGRDDNFAVDLALLLYIYLTPFVVLFGVTGNFLSVYVFYSSKLRFQSTSQYLSALAISDSLFLLSLLPPWLSAIKVTGLFHRKGFCQIFVYISYVTSCLSAWLVIAFTFERFVAVLYPLQRNSFCSVKRARYIIIGLVILSLTVNSPILIFAGTGDEGCNIDREKLIHAARFNWVDTTVTFAIPTILILFLNMWIVFGVQKLEKTRMQLVKQETPPPGKGAARQLSCPRSQHRVTKMLLIVSSVYLLLNLPAYTMRLLAYAYDGKNSTVMDSTWLRAIEYTSTFMFNANYGINFILYCLSGQNFRRALMSACPMLACIARNEAIPQNAINRGRTQSLTTSAASNGTENYGQSSTLPSRHPYLFRWNRDELRRSRPERPTEDIEMTEVVNRPSALSMVVTRRADRAGGL